jgi:hypothetical protein
MGFSAEAGVAIGEQYLRLTAKKAPPLAGSGAFRSFRPLR